MSIIINGAGQTVAICCSTCKHADKKITEEPCFICSPWCDKWEDKNGLTTLND